MTLAGVKPGRVLLSSKSRLSGDRPQDLVDDLQLSVAAVDLFRARQRLLELSGEAHQGARDAVTSLNLRTIEHIVVRRSRDEGIWEGDTLLRLLRVEYEHRLRELLVEAGGAALAEVIDRLERLRGSVDQKAKPHPTTVDEATRLMTRERYERDEVINRTGLPLANGDIFERTTDQSYWMLVDQACDLQLRDEEDRRADISTTELIAVTVVEPDKALKRAWVLPPTSHVLPVACQLVLSKRLCVPYDVLELCVFDRDGRCRIDTSCTSSEIPAQTPALSRRWTNVLRAHQRTLAILPPDPSPALVGRVFGPVEAEGVVEEGCVIWPLRRVERLKAPWAQAALTALNEDRARMPFEHDFHG
jgi:hypothetical protein